MGKHPGSPTATKFKATTSVQIVMTTVFWVRKRLSLVNFIHKEETISADHYIETLHKLQGAIHQKCVGTQGIKLLFANASLHTAN